MSETKFLEGIELLRQLSLVFGPTGSEEAVADEIVKQLENTDAQIIRDRMSNVFAVLHGKNRPEKTVMLSAHMDEVGFIIKEIDGDGYIRFGCLGGIDSRVLCGRKVTFRGKEGDVSGVIASKAIHHQSDEERKNATKANEICTLISARPHVRMPKAFFPAATAEHLTASSSSSARTTLTQSARLLTTVSDASL